MVLGSKYYLNEYPEGMDTLHECFGDKNGPSILVI